MDETPAARLVSRLRGLSLRNRIGVLLLPPDWLGLERELAVRLGITYRDYRELALSRVTPDQKFLPTNWRGFISRDLDGLVREARPDGDCVMVANADLPISSLCQADRERLWSFLREIYKPAWGLLLTLPEASHRLITEDERRRWAIGQRLANWE